MSYRETVTTTANTQTNQPHSQPTNIQPSFIRTLCVVNNKQSQRNKSTVQSAFFKTFFFTGLIIQRITVGRTRPPRHFAGKLSRLRVRSRFPFTIYFCVAPRCAPVLLSIGREKLPTS